MKTSKKIKKRWLILPFCLIILFPAAWLSIVKMEGEKPAVILDMPSDSIGIKKEISITVTDPKSGVYSIWAGLLQGGKETVLFEKKFPGSRFIGGGKVRRTSFSIKIEPKKMGMVEGKAILRMVVNDYSWRGWWHGNRTYIEKNVMIDTTPPEVLVLSKAHNVSQGGSCLVIYRLNEPCSKSGVYAGGNFFPGYSGYFKDQHIFMSFFALGYDQGQRTNIFVKAIDFAGNSTRSGFPHYIKKKVFKKDSINITDRFLEWKMPEFDTGGDIGSSGSLLDKFLFVNRKLRRDNYVQIKRLAKNTDNRLYWSGAFLRLPGSTRKAGFADHRKYKYKGTIVDRQVHLGIDLASVAHAKVPASNRGKVVFTKTIGIYGQTVMIDHGFGLFSTYSHLSSYSVKPGQIVSKGDIIGRTGNTGMAGGDHLHLGIMVHDIFVNPIEWWDESWVRHNITDKIKFVKSNQTWINRN